LKVLGFSEDGKRAHRTSPRQPLIGRAIEGCAYDRERRNWQRSTAMRAWNAGKHGRRERRRPFAWAAAPTKARSDSVEIVVALWLYDWA
jgi:hypothetical protein